MEPRIQYAQTADGVNIAFYTLGEGMPLVYMPSFPWSHIQMEWQNPSRRSSCERLAQSRMLVRYDSRGCGLSDRDVADFSLDAHVADLEAVVGRLGLERFGLLAGVHAGPVAIAYAARNQERVSHLILYCTYARVSDFAKDPRAQGLEALADKDWRLFTRTVANMLLGWSTGEQARRLADVLRASTTHEAYRATVAASREWDVTALLPQVRSPTLVLHHRQLAWPDVGLARGLASRIPEARLTVLEGASVIPDQGDSESVLAAIDEFLDEGEEAEGDRPAAGAVRTILFTDMESSTALRRKLGDAKVQGLVRTHNQIVRRALGEHAGNEIKHTGDGIMASFTTATSALECAIAIQRGVASHSEEHADMPLGVYIGLNAGEPIAEEQDLFGTSVDLARRICDHADPGQILASNVVRELSEGKGFLFADIGDVVPKGFEQPVRLYEVRWREDA